MVLLVHGTSCVYCVPLKWYKLCWASTEAGRSVGLWGVGTVGDSEGEPTCIMHNTVHKSYFQYPNTREVEINFVGVGQSVTHALLYSSPHSQPTQPQSLSVSQSRAALRHTTQLTARCSQLTVLTGLSQSETTNHQPPPKTLTHSQCHSHRSHTYFPTHSLTISLSHSLTVTHCHSLITHLHPSHKVLHHTR